MVSIDGAGLFSSTLAPFPRGCVKCCSALDPCIHNTFPFLLATVLLYRATTPCFTMLLPKLGQVLHHALATANKSQKKKLYTQVLHTRRLNFIPRNILASCLAQDVNRSHVIVRLYSAQNVLAFFQSVISIFQWFFSLGEMVSMDD